MNINASMIVVRKPGEPTEEYQDQIADAGKSDFANKLAECRRKIPRSTESKGRRVIFGDKQT